MEGGKDKKRAAAEMFLSSTEAIKKERNWEIDKRKARKTGRQRERHKLVK